MLARSFDDRVEIETIHRYAGGHMVHFISPTRSKGPIAQQEQFGVETRGESESGGREALALSKSSQWPSQEFVYGPLGM